MKFFPRADKLIYKKIKNKKIFFIFILSIAVLVVAISFYFLKKASTYPVLRNSFRNTTIVRKVFPAAIPKKIGWVSDIHADRFKRRQVDSGLLFPRRYKEQLPSIFDDMKKQGIDTVIATGDNVNSCDENYANDILRIAREKKMFVVWVRGNHDCAKTMTLLGVKDIAGKYYYFYDYGDTRIVVLDDVQMDPYDYFGSIDKDQLVWFRTVLETKQKVIVAMHIPIFAEDALMEKYIELEKIIHEAGNVKLFLSGHYHKIWQKEYASVSYRGEATLTQDGAKGQYGIIDLNNFSVEYKEKK